jgi:hypothetical protein
VCGLVLVNPCDAKRVEDQLVVQTQLGRIEDGLPRKQDFEVLRYAPELVFGALAILAGELGGVGVAIKPRMRLSRRHGHSFRSRLAEWSKWLCQCSTMLRRDRIHARHKGMASDLVLERGTRCGGSLIYEPAEPAKGENGA